METFKQWYERDGSRYDYPPQAAEEAWNVCEKQWKDEVRKISDIIEISETGIVTVNYSKLKQKLLELL